MRYTYVINGTAAEGQTWVTSGLIEIEELGNFPDVPMLALKDSFLKLTHGNAVFGNPGLGCNGPYTITRMLIEKNEPEIPTPNNGGRPPMA